MSDTQIGELTAPNDTIEQLEADLHDAQVAWRGIQNLVDHLARMTREPAPYSAEQLRNFEESCYVPPPQFTEWIHDGYPELPPGHSLLQVIGCGYAENDPEKRECVGPVWFHDKGHYESLGEKIIVRCFMYIPAEAPPKPLGEAVDVEVSDGKI